MSTFVHPESPDAPDQRRDDAALRYKRVAPTQCDIDEERQSARRPKLDAAATGFPSPIDWSDILKMEEEVEFGEEGRMPLPTHAWISWADAVKADGIKSMEQAGVWACAAILGLILRGFGIDLGIAIKYEDVDGELLPQAFKGLDKEQAAPYQYDSETLTATIKKDTPERMTRSMDKARENLQRAREETEIAKLSVPKLPTLAKPGNGNVPSPSTSESIRQAVENIAAAAKTKRGLQP